eukprot:3778161-Pyramimonas_sp.AAC.1
MQEPSLHPILVGYDFGRAIPSVSQQWMLMVLATLPIPRALEYFFELMNVDVSCWGKIGHIYQFLFHITS